MIELEIEEEQPTVYPEGNRYGKFQFGIHYDMPNRTYHKHKGISSTSIPIMHKSFAAFENKHLFGSWSPAFSAGSLLHTAVLEPHLVHKEYIECSTIGMDTVQAGVLKAQHPDKIVVGNGMIDKYIKRADGIRIIFGDILGVAKKEVSVIYDNRDVNGLIYKARPDILLESHGTVLDLKSSQANCHKEFEKTIEKYSYHIQASWYIDTCKLAGLDIKQFAWIVSPNDGSAPFGVLASDEMIEKGRTEYQELLYGYTEYKAGNINDILFKEAHTWQWILEQRQAYKESKD